MSGRVRARGFPHGVREPPACQRAKSSMSREGETLALQETSGPLTRLEMAAMNDFEKDMAEHEARQEIGKQQKKLREGQIAKDPKAKRDVKGVLHDVLAVGEEDKPPARRRYIVNDSSIEKLGEILNQNSRRFTYDRIGRGQRRAAAAPAAGRVARRGEDLAQHRPRTAPRGPDGCRRDFQ